MPRRRLHGETQKRRQKPAVRTLKLRATVQRKHETRAPLPFEGSPELSTDDRLFLEAMRDLRVRKLPGQGGAPVRQEAIQRAYVAADTESDRMFQAAMEHLGVAPIGPDGRPVPGMPAIPTAARPRESLLDDDIDDEGFAQEAEDEVAEADRPAPRGMGRVDGEPHAPEAIAREVRRGATRAPPDGTRFDDSEDGARLMEEALRADVAGGLKEKFEGAPAPKRLRKSVARSSSAKEPDDELDLHGRTQEEAIRMVQHFLLTAKGKRLRTALIITGKGLNSGSSGPVLRGAVQHWLERNGSPYVRSFAWAPARLGGDGAIWIELW